MSKNINDFLWVFYSVLIIAWAGSVWVQMPIIASVVVLGIGWQLWDALKAKCEQSGSGEVL